MPDAPRPPDRIFGFPSTIEKPLYLFEQDADIKSHPAYVQAKAGNQEAAFRLVADLALEFLFRNKNRLPENAIYVAPFAREATGDNAIPQVLAVICAMISNGSYDENIVQITRVYHTGADPMERLALRPSFEGPIISGGKYVLVDDVTSMGGTLAELANYVQFHGGLVENVLVLVNAGRDKRLHPPDSEVRKLKKRYENDIKTIFGIDVAALTANEAHYLIGFRSVDEIRNRRIKASQETNLRLRSKGLEREV